MYKITKKGGCAIAFKLKDKRVFNFEPDVAVEISDDEYKAIMAEYSSFILPRIWSESNLNGCFLVVKKEEQIVNIIDEEIKQPIKKKNTRKK